MPTLSSSLSAQIYFAAFLIWLAVEVINHLIGKWGRVAQPALQQDRGSYWLIICLSLPSFGLAFAGGFLPWNSWAEAVQLAGLALMIAGIGFRQWAILSLGRHFSVVVAIESDHQLITRGPYRWLRHPAYTGALLTVLGFQLTLGNWLSLLLAIITLIPAFAYRIRVEEETLLTQFGDDYRRYSQRSWRLFPGW